MAAEQPFPNTHTAESLFPLAVIVGDVPGSRLTKRKYEKSNCGNQYDA